MSESPSSGSSTHATHGLDYALPGLGGPPKLLRLGGALGIAACVVGLLVFLAACMGFNAAFAFSWIPLGLGAIGFILSVVGGVTERPKLVEDTAVLGALFACCMGIIGGLLEVAVWRGWHLLPGQGGM
jgi:hypothetical protein